MISRGLAGYPRPMSEIPVTISPEGRAYFTEGVLAYAGPWVHDEPQEDHTHSFVEIAVVTGGEAVQRSLAGRQQLRTGDAVFLRPGVWHGYDTGHLELYNCCFSAELLHRELAWTREDPLLGYLLWTGPLSMGRRGMLVTTLDAPALRDCLVHLDALDRLRLRPLGLYRSDIISHLTLVLGHLARAVAVDRDRLLETHASTRPASWSRPDRPIRPWSRPCSCWTRSSRTSGRWASWPPGCTSPPATCCGCSSRRPGCLPCPTWPGGGWRRRPGCCCTPTSR